MNRRDFLPTYHFEDTESNEIKDLAEEKLRDYVITGNHGKNLIPFPYVSTSGTQNGIEINVDSDGVITLNGTATAGIYFGLLSPVNSSGITKPGKYTISGMPGAVSGVSIQCYVDGNWGSKYNDVGNGATFTVTSSIKYITLQINSGAVCDNVVIKPMLEEGETKTEFEPWCGVGDKTKNLIPYPYYDTTKTINGVTFTDNGDGTITANGTATGVGASFLVFSNSNGLVGQGKYYLSGCPSNNGSAASLQPKIDNEFHPDNYDFGKGQTITVQSTLTQILCLVSSGKTVHNVTFRPFLAKADSATSYEPYGYKIELLNKPWNNLINVDDFESTQTNG